MLKEKKMKYFVIIQCTVSSRNMYKMYFICAVNHFINYRIFTVTWILYTEPQISSVKPLEGFIPASSAMFKLQ